jgi:hypothetical protein
MNINYRENINILGENPYKVGYDLTVPVCPLCRSRKIEETELPSPERFGNMWRCVYCLNMF